jgi:hypothetical protein
LPCTSKIKISSTIFFARSQKIYVARTVYLPYEHTNAAGTFKAPALISRIAQNAKTFVIIFRSQAGNAGLTMQKVRICCRGDFQSPAPALVPHTVQNAKRPLSFPAVKRETPTVLFILRGINKGVTPYSPGGQGGGGVAAPLRGCGVRSPTIITRKHL